MCTKYFCIDFFVARVVKNSGSVHIGGNHMAKKGRPDTVNTQWVMPIYGSIAA